MIQKKHLIVIAGPTAVGKTSTTIKIAQHFDCEIINSDSRQFYREMTIGTAKPSEQELKSIHHHFIDNLSIHDSYNVGDFEKDTHALLKEVFKTKDVVLMTGGSGLYIRAVTEGLDKFPDIPAKILADLNHIYKSDGIAGLQEELRQVDLDYYNSIDIHNHRRIIRALSVFKASGQPFSSFLNQKKEKKDFEIHYILLERDREELYQRINLRVDLMVDAGLEEEARSLFEFKGLKSLQTVGYQEFFSYFDGTISRDDAIELIKRNSRRYAKRQMTWFRKRPHWVTFSAEDFDGVLGFLEENIL